LIGLLGSALLYGDGLITPAISVLSAAEGLSIISSQLKVLVLPFTIVILSAVFYFQKYGSQKIGFFFGPIVLIWLSSIAILGTVSIIQSPEVLVALSPYYSLRFLFENFYIAIPVLGSIFLVVTGGEALYADMGHFGKKPIKITWIFIVFPALVLNYFGQGALLLRDPSAIDHPFYSLAPSWLLIPLVIMATLATIIASQAVISGAFSLTNQAIQLGYLPKMRVKYTSKIEMGQIYVPKINLFLYIATIFLVISFQTSGRLAAAYGIAVSLTMVLTTLLMYKAAKNIFKWNQFKVMIVITLLLIVDILFFTPIV